MPVHKWTKVGNQWKVLVPLRDDASDKIKFRYVDKFGRLTKTKKPKPAIAFQYCHKCNFPNRTRKACSNCSTPLEEIKQLTIL